MTSTEKAKLEEELEMLTRLLKGLVSTVARLRAFLDQNV